MPTPLRQAVLRPFEQEVPALGCGFMTPGRVARTVLGGDAAPPSKRINQKMGSGAARRHLLQPARQRDRRDQDRHPRVKPEGRLFSHDPEHQRFKQVSPEGTTDYVSAPERSRRAASWPSSTPAPAARCNGTSISSPMARWWPPSTSLRTLQHKRRVGDNALSPQGPSRLGRGPDRRDRRRRRARQRSLPWRILGTQYLILYNYVLCPLNSIVLVQDNLNIHCRASLYEAFPAAEARRLVERFEWHFTPKHGSWLDLAESELGVLSSQCLDRRIPDKQTLADEIDAWVRDRNDNHATANWHLTTPNARTKLKHLYPAI